MSSPKNNKITKLSYAKAQFQPLLKPAFWLAATLLSLLLVVVWEYWHNPSWQKALLELASGTENNATVATKETESAFSEELKYSDPDVLAAESGYTSEELAAIADIDNVDLLLNGSQTETPVAISPQPKKQQQKSDKSSTPERETLYEQLVREQQANANKVELIPQPPKPKSNSQVKNPFLEESQALLNTNGYDRSGLYLNPNNSSGNSLLNSNNESTTANNQRTSQQSTELSSLQQALNALTAVDSESETGESQVREETRERESLAQSSPTNNNLQIDAGNGYQNGVTPFNRSNNYSSYGQVNSPTQVNSFTYFTQPQTPNLTPSPVQVTPGSANTYGQFSNQRTTVTNPYNASLNNSSVQPSQIQPGQLNPTPNSNSNTRRRYPGRYIGGGEINTFSNP
ncbi:MAG: hypothetical protein SAJ37_21365 [Oscillatoria sp. PMC 1068.18]|nr:hypothetical protein [Oscillatoria sp. PMC 1076.18]MEC4991292.1 hypothetical protein [Oscillatoria sp. PMC 1068.18]